MKVSSKGRKAEFCVLGVLGSKDSDKATAASWKFWVENPDILRPANPTVTARVESLSKKSEVYDLSGSADSCDVQDAAGKVAHEGSWENEGLDMDRVDPPVEVGPKISSINLSDSAVTLAGGGVKKEETI